MFVEELDFTESADGARVLVGASSDGGGARHNAEKETERETWAGDHRVADNNIMADVNRAT